jgi:dTDP-4-amino-4,6-dideoxygalactose transaminase
MGELLRIAEAHGLRVIEDCAHAIETLIEGKPAGTLGDFGSFSFYATKNLTTGEGGMLLGKDEALLHKSRALSLHGVSKDAFMRREAEQFLPYDVVGAGYKYNMMDLQAALGLHQLAEVGENHKKRAFIWQRYGEAIAELPLAGPPALPTGPDRHGLHLFTVQVSPERAGLSRDELAARLRVAGIGTGVHYTSLADFPYYQERCGFHPEQVPHATRVSRHILSLPLSAHLSAEEVTRVIDSLREALMP